MGLTAMIWVFFVCDIGLAHMGFAFYYIILYWIKGYVSALYDMGLLVMIWVGLVDIGYAHMGFSLDHNWGFFV